MQQFFLSVFYYFKILNHNHHRVYSMYNDRRDLLSKISARTRQASHLNSPLKANHKCIQVQAALFLGATVTKKTSSKSGIPEAEVGPEETPYLQDTAKAVWARWPDAKAMKISPSLCIAELHKGLFCIRRYKGICVGLGPPCKNAFDKVPKVKHGDAKFWWAGGLQAGLGQADGQPSSLSAAPRGVSSHFPGAKHQDSSTAAVSPLHYSRIRPQKGHRHFSPSEVYKQQITASQTRIW